MEVMKPGPLPDFRDMPACPRKAVDENTMKQHRNCFEASEPRIRVALRHGTSGKKLLASCTFLLYLSLLLSLVESW